MSHRSRFLVTTVFVLMVALAGCGQPVTTTAPPTTASITPQTVAESPAPTKSITPAAPTSTSLPKSDGVPADVIFYNGVILTMDSSHPQAQAIAIQGNKILAVGSDTEIMARNGPKTQLIDLAGLTIMPGFIDGHSHLLAFPDRMGKTIDQAQEIAIRYGITSVTEMWANQGQLDILMEAEKKGTLRMRVNVFPIYNEGSLNENRQSAIDETWYPAHKPILDTDRQLRIPGIKIFVDGDFTPARGCWALSEPYLPEALASLGCGTNKGDLYLSQNALNRVVAGAQKAGFSVAFHSMGDGAIEQTLNAIEYALGGQSNDQFRHMIQHNSLLRPDQLTRYADMDVIASVRGYADFCDATTGLAEWGPDRQTWYANRFAIPGLGTHAFIESDFGWTADPANRFANRTLDPIVHLYGIVTHRYVGNDGSVCEAAPWVAVHKVSVERALQMYTIEPAYAVFMEEVIGSLEPGKYADLIILSGNPMTVDPNTLKDLKVWMTMINGEVEYCAAGQEEICP